MARSIGRKHAMELLLTDVVVARSAPVIANGKRTFYAQVDAGIGEAYEVAGCAMVTDLAGADSAEGIDAFLAKRAPAWPSGCTQ